MTSSARNGTNASVLTYHRIIEAFKFGYAWRSRLGDPAFNMDKNISEVSERYRGYYMAARRYEISLRVLKNKGKIIFSTLTPGYTWKPVYVRWASPVILADPLYISRRAGPLADEYAVKNIFTMFAKPTRQWLHGNYVHIELSHRLIHTYSLSVFSENASIWKRSWKWIKTKSRTYDISVDGRKRSKNASKWKRCQNIAGAYVFRSLCGMRMQFYRLRTFYSKTHHNGSVDANRSMRFWWQRKCRQGLKLIKNEQMKKKKI